MTTMRLGCNQVALVLLICCFWSGHKALGFAVLVEEKKKPADELLRCMQHARESGSAILVPGVHDALSAKIMARHHCQAMFVSGFGISASRLDVPDAGILTRTELQQAADSIIQNHCQSEGGGERRRVPVIVDGDTGFGGSVNVFETIRGLARIGAAAVSIEDQVFPKRCTYVAGSGVNIVTRQQAMDRIRTALHARDNFSDKILVIARTDCRRALGFEEAKSRCLAFQELGADIVYAEALQSREEYIELREALRQNENGDMPTYTMLAQVQQSASDIPWTTKEIGDMGFELALFGISALQANIAALESVAAEMISSGGPAPATPLASFDKVKNVVDFEAVEKLEEEYGCT